MKPVKNNKYNCQLIEATKLRLLMHKKKYVFQIKRQTLKGNNSTSAEMNNSDYVASER